MAIRLVSDRASFVRPWCVVPIYRPGDDVVANLVGFATQAPVVAVDDGSPESFRPLLDRIARLPGVELIEHDRNRGIAAALNLGISTALDYGADIIVTFDQDTRADASHVDALVDVLSRHRGAALAGPGIVGGVAIDPAVTTGDPVVDVYSLYQSGMALPRETILRLGAFDEDLFIDCVDTEYCLRARAGGQRVVAVTTLAMAHQLGAGHENFRRVRIGPFTPVATFHSADRRYYITRNQIRLIARYGSRERRWALLALRRLLGATVLAVTVEDCRLAKLRAIARGGWHACINHAGPLRSRVAENDGSLRRGGVVDTLRWARRSGHGRRD